MKRIAAIIPTYKRSHLLLDFIRHFEEVSTEATLYFVVSSDDPETRELLEKYSQNYFCIPGEYVAAINHGYRNTYEEFAVFASDDVVFMKGWDKKILKMADENPDKAVFGGIDEWKISQTMLHISHPTVRRKYFGLTDAIYYPEYIHYMCDIEFMQRCLRDNCVMITPKILISHPHTVTEHTNKKDWDETYKRSFSKIEHDRDLYERRKGEFELYNFDDLKEGRATPTKLNPEYNKTLLSIVIPSYRDYEILQETLKSVVENTYYRFELILIDDGPHGELINPWTIINRVEFFDAIRLKDQSCSVRVFRNKKQKWVNHNWNLGARKATGNYVAFLNSDILLSKNWDMYLVSALETPYRKATIACPYETNEKHKKPFMLDPLIMKALPHMIKGQCFLVRRADIPKLFPIPKELKHWCGDNWLADRAREMDGVVFASQAVCHHYISQSSNKVKPLDLQKRTYLDILHYEKLSGRNLNFIKRRFPDVIRNYCSVNEDGYKSLPKS